MSEAYYEYDFSKAGPLADGTADAKIKANVRKAIRGGMAMLEKHHKFIEMRWGAPKAPPIPNKLTNRTKGAGGLAPSYKVFISSDGMVGSYGSNKIYARIHELGGMAGRGRKVRIPPRPGIKYTERDNRSRIHKMIADAVGKAV